MKIIDVLLWQSFKIQLIDYFVISASFGYDDLYTVTVSSYRFRSTNWTLILFAVFEPCFHTFKMKHMTTLQL